MAQSVRHRHVESANASSSHRQGEDGTDTYDQNSALESQNKTFGANASVEEERQPIAPKDDAEKVDYSELFERLIGTIARFRGSIWWFIGAVAIAIPLAVIPTVFSKKVIAGIRVTGFLAWIEIIWTAGWVLRFLLHVISKLWGKICMKHDSWAAWDGFFENTAWTLSGFALSVVAWGSSSIMCHIGEGSCNIRWLKILRKILLATIPVSALFLAEDMLVQIMATTQASKMAKERHLETLARRVKAIEMLPYLIRPGDPDKKTAKERVVTLVKRVFLKDMRESDEVKEAYDDLLRGKGGSEQFATQRKLVIDSMRTQYLVDGNGDDFIFDETSLSRMLASPDGKELNSRKKLNGKPFTVAEIMKMMDKDDDGEVTWYEFIEFMAESMSAFYDILRGVHGINRAARSVSLVVSFLLLFVAAIIYAAFFVHNLSAYLTPIWTTVTGLSFALGGTATEFIAACQFVFSKQPYNVGDRVIIEDKELLVIDVCLLYTVFHRYPDFAVEQIAHKKISDSWITNLSRSKGLFIKEAAATPEKADFITMAWLDDQQDVLAEFIKQNLFRKRYLDAKDVKLSMQMGKDDRQQLVAEIRLRDVFVRDEAVLARVKGQIRERLQKMFKDHARQGPPYAVPPPPLPPRSNVA